MKLNLDILVFRRNCFVLIRLSLQGRVVLRDFNIAREANGPGIGIDRNFTNVTVNGSTLEIHLYWTGKGTNAVPRRSVYGPLISAISITPSKFYLRLCFLFF